MSYLDLMITSTFPYPTLPTYSCPTTTGLYTTNMSLSSSRPLLPRNSSQQTTSVLSKPPQLPLNPPKLRVHAPLPTFTQDIYVSVPIDLLADILQPKKRKSSFSSTDPHSEPASKRRRETSDNQPPSTCLLDRSASSDTIPPPTSTRHRRHFSSNRRSTVIQNKSSSYNLPREHAVQRKSSQEILLKSIPETFQIVPHGLAPLRRSSRVDEL